MTNKQNINQTVSKILSMDIAVQKGLSRGIINTRALAKHIIKQYGLTASLDSVISAIRRYERQENFEEEEKKILHIFRGAVISTKNNVACMTLELRPRELLNKLCINPNSKIPIKISTGTRATKIIFENPAIADIDGYSFVQKLFNCGSIAFI